MELWRYLGGGRNAALRHWLLIVLLCACLPLHAARRSYYFDNLGSEQGLQQNTVSALMQDRTGFIWIATQGGLHRYDGYSFRIFEQDPERGDSLPDSFVTAIGEDPDGHIWVGTNTKGLSNLDPRSGTVQEVPAGSRATTPRGNSICAVQADARNRIWVGSREGIDLVDPQAGTRQSLFRFEADNLPLRPLRRFVNAPDGSLYAATSQGLLKIDRSTAKASRLAAPALRNTLSALIGRDGTLYAGTAAGFLRVSADGSRTEQLWPPAGAEPANVFDAVEDASGRIWLAVRGAGVVRLDPHSGENEWLHHQRDLPGSLPEESITTLMIDRSGLLWLGGETRGAATTRPTSETFTWLVDLEAPHDRVTRNMVSGLYSDEPGYIWIGTEGDGLKRYDRERDRYENWNDSFAKALGLRVPPQELCVYSIAGAGDGKLWLASSHGPFEFDPRTRQASLLPIPPLSGAAVVASGDQETRALARGADGTLWLGSRTKGLFRYGKKGELRNWRHDDADPASLPHNMVLALLEDRQGRLWVGTLDGLALLDSSGRLHRLNTQAGAHASQSGNLIRTIYQAKDDTIWVGTHSGLLRLDELTDDNARFSRISSQDGLTSNTIYGILEDVAGALWLSTNRGITRYEPGTRQVRNFALKDGLQAYEFNGGAAFSRSPDELLFGGVNGTNLIRPDTLAQHPYNAPVVITALTVGSRREQLAGDSTWEWSIPQAERLLRFEFAALDYSAPETNRFAWKLDGFDEDWIEGGTRHDVSYTNLDPGDYRFRVRSAASRDGKAQESSLPFEIVPPWWASLWMKLIYAGIASLVVLAIWRERRSKRAEEQRHQNELRAREDRLRLALWGSGDEFWDYDMRGGRIYRFGADQLLGSSPEESLSADDWRNFAVHPDDLPRVDRTMADHVAGVTSHFESEHRVAHAQGGWIWVLSRGKIVERDSDGEPARISGTARNVTASRLAERERRIAAEVIRNMTEAVTVTDLDYHFTSVNLAFTRMTGYREDEVLGLNAAVLNSPQHAPEVYEQMRETLGQTGHWRGELWQRRKDGEEFLSWLELAEVRDGHGMRTHFVGVLADITDRKRAEQELRYLANYDTLTGLPNRTLLGERLGHAIMRARRNGRRVAVLFLDLDRFKHVNDSMGHAAGDRMLKAAGSRLRAHVRDSDTVARLGGDEFTVVLEDVHDGSEAEHIAQKLLLAFGEPLALDAGQEVVISPSIGISLYPDHAQVPTDLLKYADTAMYQAKESGRNTYKVYTSEMDSDARRRATMVGALRKAMERGEFRLVFQPKLSLSEARIVGVEALLRWHSEDLGEISPGVFIPLAEEAGLIIDIGEFVLDRACATLARWREQGISDVVMAVNLSVLQLLRGELTRRLCEILAEHDIAPQQIELELTESTIMNNAEQSVRTLNELKSIGVSLAIDDFGTGYSSLSYLKRLPIDTLKIDKEFVGDLTTDPDDEAITATIITMAHSLGLNVIAEGVETHEQLEYLREQGCDEIQGNWLSLPLSAERCLEFLKSRRGGAIAL
ncbi:diguanylate cyclase/phosphodiesterase with PAS/PAC sensor(s) [Tahibacter aquaticus]|uniref:Diguanylate cyclase/phosphodiesterase with PAS/PAC sensor(S) n=1 Tax=Tahibacter aquaticus TaxID=520092 RepID=A0A4R6ZAK8_9GAMM|nr:EAL domain-containing protein [Tahibacter aquaticus]TDR48872.1 diguanylate cyclase/phosphodiesterase with PAS/PAC sensor(s) [Tahibacter aquaticus]